jgi:hypothetical protein
MMIEETRLLLPRGGMGVLEYRERGSEEVIAIRPVEISDTRAPYLTRTARVPRRPVGFWNAPIKEGEEERGEKREEEEGKIMGGEEEGEKSVKPSSKPFEPPFLMFLEDFAVAWKHFNEDELTIESLIPKPKDNPKDKPKDYVYPPIVTDLQNPKNLGSLVSIFKNNIFADIDRNVWVSTIAENVRYNNTKESADYPYMSDPVIRKQYLVEIANRTIPDGDVILRDTGFTANQIIDLLLTAYTSSQEIIPPTRRNPNAKIITMNTEGLIETVDIDGKITSTGDVTKVTIGQGLHGYRSRQVMASRVARYLPPGILRFFIQDITKKEYLKESVKGRMCDDVYGLGIVGKKLSVNFYDFMKETYPDIVFSDELINLSVRLYDIMTEKYPEVVFKEAISKTNMFTGAAFSKVICIYMEIITRAIGTYRPPHLSGTRIV